MNFTMFDTMLQLPLFQGLVHDDFTTILERVKLGFVKHKAGEVIARAGYPCDRLTFLLKGEISITTAFPGVPCHLTEYLSAPYVIEPQSLFGMHTSFASTYAAHSEEVQTLSVSKTFVVNELFRYDIFRLNYTNMVCNRMRNLRNRLWTLPDGTLEQRILQFVNLHSLTPDGPKMLKIKMSELAAALNDSRVNVSRALNEMQQSGILTLNRGRITFHDTADSIDRPRGLY